MQDDKCTADHNEHLENPQHEALLAGAIALASLFSSCVEAFGLIHPSQKWEKQEQLLLTRLGLQQARLLIWGSVLGVASPPASVTNSAVPKHPSGAYPDLTEPTFFDARDPRLDDPEVRTTIEQTLSAIVDRSSQHTREEMMAKYGLKPPKRYGTILEPALDVTRLASFREKYELLRQVAEDVAQINTRRNNSIVRSPWMIADVSKFGDFIQLTQDKVDYLINLMDVKEKVDRAMRMDIRVFGWHVIPDRARSAQDISKLRLLQETCTVDYPEYMAATQQALDNIGREAREQSISSYSMSKEQAAFVDPRLATEAGHDKDKKRPGLLKLFKSFGKKDHGRSQSVSASATIPDTIITPQRSQSDAGPDLSRARSKSIGAEHEVETPAMLDEDLRNRLSKMDTHTSEGTNGQFTIVEPFGKPIDSPIESSGPAPEPAPRPMPPLGVIERHDMYRGIARTNTRDLHQADY